MLRMCCLLLLILSNNPSHGASTPEPTVSFDLKPYGWLVERGRSNHTTLGFPSEDTVSVHLSQVIGGRVVGKLIVFSIQEKKILSYFGDVSCEVRFLPGGNWLCFHNNQVDLYKPDLKLLKTYVASPGADWGFAARADMVQLSPDGLEVSIALDHGSEILATKDLSWLRRTESTIMALGKDRWFARQGSSSVETEQMPSEDGTKDLRQLGSNRCPETATYLNPESIFVEDCNGRMDVTDLDHQVRFRVGKELGSLAVVADVTGNRFATEVYIDKSFDWSGAAQAKKTVVRVFDVGSGKELFHLQDVPSENEPTFYHYIALSPNGTRLAEIRSGVLRIYDLTP